MSTKLFLTLIMSCTLLASHGQFAFSVSPGIGMNSAYFGYHSNKFVPYVGFQYLNASFKYEETGQKFDYDLYQIVSYTSENTFSGNLYLPSVGLKYFILERNSLKGYLSLSVAKPFISGKIKYDGEEDEEFTEDVKNLSMWGGQLGFGIEHFFGTNFSLGGEFGIRYVHLVFEDSRQEWIYNPNQGTTEQTSIQENYKFNLSPTFARISFNFYF